MEPIVISKQSGNSTFCFVFSFSPVTLPEDSYYDLDFTFYRKDIYVEGNANTFFQWQGPSTILEPVPFNIPILLQSANAQATGAALAAQKLPSTSNKKKSATIEEDSAPVTDPEEIVPDSNNCSGAFSIDVSMGVQYVWFDMHYGTSANSEHFIGNMLAFPQGE